MRVELISKKYERSFVEWLNADHLAYDFVHKSSPPSRNTNELFASLLNNNSDPGYNTWLCLNEKKEVVGLIEIKPTQKVESHEREIVYIVREPHRRRGVATFGISQVLASGFHPTIRTVVAFVNPKNTASQKVLTACGFSMAQTKSSGLRYILHT